MAHVIIKQLPYTMKFFGINIDYMAEREQRFAKGCERYETKQPELVAYLRKLRPFLLEIVEQFNKMRVEGWNLSNVKYSFSDGTISMVEPQIAGETVSKYIERVFDRLALVIEDIIMYGFQRLGAPMAIAEIPPAQRDPMNAQRFRAILRGSEPLWQLAWTDQDFYES